MASSLCRWLVADPPPHGPHRHRADDLPLPPPGPTVSRATRRSRSCRDGRALAGRVTALSGWLPGRAGV